jgi:uroporphyrin-III C-methyltransferase/precorrin-2 dehydrogenase/sirohydrochlorin ferrochelatase/uroporphyrin-III C-methyltransferase
MLVANASQPEQQSLVGTLADMHERLAAQPLPSPCLIMVGSVVSMVAHSPAATGAKALPCQQA